MCVRARARARARGLSAAVPAPTPPHTPPHRTGPACLPRPAVLGAPQAAALWACSPLACEATLGAPRVQRPRATAPAPPGGGEAKGGGAGARKAGAHSRPALRRDGQLALKFVTAAANSWPEPGRSELAAGLEPPQLEDEARCVLLQRPSAATGVCPPGPVLPRLIGVHGAGAVAPFRVHSNLRRRIGASPPAWRCWQERGTPGRPCSRI